jgi:hypothetical protein
VDILRVYFSDESKVGVSGLINKQSSGWDTELPLEVTNSMPLNPDVLLVCGGFGNDLTERYVYLGDKIINHIT